MRRFVDKGAILAGWVGLGMAVVVTLAFELIIPIQPLVFVLAPIMGAAIGAYANVKSERWRPRWRALTNAAWAGLVTGLAAAIFYVGLRLVFVYADTGALPNGTNLECRMGPECTYARYVNAGRADELTGLGITDPSSLEAVVLGQLALSGIALVVLVLGGSLVSGAWRAIGSVRAEGRPVPA